LTQLLLLSILAYVAGSVNFAIIALRMLGKEDPRTKFSGNAGTTNVYRLAGVFWAAVVLILDVGRAGALGYAALIFTDVPMAPWVAIALLAGNRYPCFHGWRGGKGVASYIGFTAALAPLMAILSCVVWLAAYAVFRMPFIASFFMILTLAAGSIFEYSNSLISVSGVLLAAAFIFYNHRSNVMSFLKERGGVDGAKG
jgi:acyl phosphate:glycerol-3-phosphate acyltransferase